MSKKLSLFVLGAIALVGSIVAFVGTNFFMHDVLNKGGDIFGTMLTTIPMLMMGSVLVSGFLYVVRLNKRPGTFKRLSRHYLIVGLVLSAIGLLTAFLGALVIYGSFFKPYPFYGYFIIMLVLFAVMLWAAIFLLVKLKKREDDQETYKFGAGHVFATIGWFLFTALAFNRFGAFLAAPFYIQWRTLYLTFPFYLYLLCPSFIGCVKVLIDFKILTKGSRLILSMVSGFIQVALFFPIVFIGSSDTTMISAISPAMPLERLASAPLEIIIHFASMTAVSIILIVQSVRNKNVEK